MTLIHAVLIAILQGATELFPVSSLGHAVILPRVVDWAVNQRSPEFLPFLVMLHLGTAIALIVYFWRDWWALALGVFGLADANRVRQARRIFLLIVLATIPAVIVGFTLEHYVRGLFGSPLIAAVFLVINGIMLAVGEQVRGSVSPGARPISAMTATDAVVIGIWQCLALIPGISRSGSTIIGGLLRGLDHEGAARFSFLIATPIILGATVLEVPKLLHESVPPGTLTTAAIAAIVAGVTAWASTAFLMLYFRNHDRMSLIPFAIYCIVAGLGAIAVIV